MTLQHFLNILLVVLYVASMAFALFVGTYSWAKTIKDRRVLAYVVQDKLQKGIDLKAKDVQLIAYGMRMPAGSVNMVVAGLLSKVNVPELFAKIRLLVDELQKEEPLSDLPSDLRPFVSRITDLCVASPHPSDHSLVTPIHARLVGLIEANAKRSFRARLLNVLSVVGFVVGAWGTYLTWASPSTKDIQAIVTTSVQAAMQQSHAVSAPTLGP